MSHFGAAWKYRFPVMVDNLVASTAAIDVTIPLPVQLEEFWDNVQADGDDIRVTAADGVELLTYQLGASPGWDAALRTGVIELDAVTPPAQNCMFVVWVYVGNAAAVNAEGTFTPASARTGHLHDGGAQQSPILSTEPQAPTATKPRERFSKASTETIFRWADFTPRLAARREPYEGARNGEELSYVKPAVYAGASDQTAMYDRTQVRMIGNGLVRFSVLGGTTATDYTVWLTAGTTAGQILEPRYLLHVNDVDEQ